MKIHTSFWVNENDYDFVELSDFFQFLVFFPWKYIMDKEYDIIIAKGDVIVFCDESMKNIYDI